jgi:hypothetical protein
METQQQQRVHFTHEFDSLDCAVVEGFLEIIWIVLSVVIN